MPSYFAASSLALGLFASLVSGQTRFAELGKRHLPRDADTAEAVASGDVNGDGHVDLVFGSGGRNRLYLNDGGGRFLDATASHLPEGGSSRAVALGDVDGDADLDLMLGNGAGSGRQNRLYLNDGKGKFTDATASHLPTDSDVTSAVALGDLDGDGDPDLIFGR